MPSIPELAEPLTDGSVRLRPAAERDIPEVLIAYQDDSELHVRLGEERPPSGAELGRRIERAAAEIRAGTVLRLTITEPRSEDCRGQVVVHKIEWEHLRAELGIWVALQFRKQSVARRALRLTASWLLDVCGLRRVALLIEPDNQPMLRAARAAGFIDEGVLRSYARERAARVDMAVLSLIPSDLER